MRFETAPGEQLQIDFGETRVPIGGERVRVHLFVATLGYSRRPYVAVFRHERQSAWWSGIEGAFRHFGGRTARAAARQRQAAGELHDAQTREVRFNERFHAFCRYWDVLPQACAPYRARTKGKDERGVGYVKRNAIAGHRFDSLAALEAHLRLVDARSGRRPRARHDRRAADRALPSEGGGGAAAAGRAHHVPADARMVRRVHADACIELDTNRYSVPWRLIGETVTVLVSEQVRVLHAGQEVARAYPPGRSAPRVDPARALIGHRRQPSRGRGRARSTHSPAAPGRVAAAAAGVRSGHRRCLVRAATPDPDALTQMLTRLKLTAIRDQLDSLLDTATRRKLTLLETVELLCEAEVARKDERRIQMASSIAKFPFVRTLEGFEFAAQPSLDPEAGPRARHLPLGRQRRRAAVARARPASARRILPWRSAARRSSMATRRCLPRPRRW